MEVPSFWTQLATNVVVSKYFSRAGSSGEQEACVRQIIDRVVDTITAWTTVEVSMTQKCAQK